MGLQSAEWRFPNELAIECEAALPLARVIMLPTAICIVMVVLASIAVRVSSVEVSQLFLPYISSALAISLLSVLVFAFLECTKLALARADHPVAIVKDNLFDRAPLMVLPAVVLPLFLIGYTASKCAIQFLVGYGWDGVFANADKVIFGDDVWRLTRTILGSSHSAIWEWLYTVGWVTVFFVTANAAVLLGSKRFVGVYFTAMLGTWLIGGCVLAYAFSAAGPVFAGLFHPALAQRFLPMHEALDSSLGNGPIRFTQHYLVKIAGLHVALKGAGISAMPSMHVASMSIIALAARRTGWFLPSVGFWLIIFVASGYFGYHYWVDGIAAAVLAAAIWSLSEAAFDRKYTLRDELDQGRVPRLADRRKLAQKAR